MDEGAAFGFFPQLRPRRRLQDPTASADVPLQVLRGRLAGLLGAPADIGNIVRSPMPIEMFGDYEYEKPPQLPYTTEYFLKELPLAPTSPVGQLAGQAASFVPLNPAPLVRGAQKLGTMVGQGMAERVATGRPMLPSLLAEPQSAMFIVPPSEARNINMPVSLPQSKEFATAVKNEPSAQITDEGLLINLVRKQAPEQAMAESVRTGVFYLPEGQAANLKHYKGKSGYGGSEMIEGQTLYKNPIFVKGATGGKAPESAYDQIIGKGAYEEMRNDVLKSYGYNANQSQKIEAVQGLLQKYNGLDSDDAYNMAYNIVSNSKTGNTLPYAIQENIVGHAVRNAGHDAVIGYSKGRGDKGEFFSEIFDVREQAYPNTQGGYELMPKFDQMRQGKADILAGLLPASLLADPETRRKLDEELSLLYTK